MSDSAHAISDSDWNQLMTLAAGYLVLEDGDVKAAMSRALAAHTELIRALKREAIRAEVSQGTVTMFVPDEGGVALRLERNDPAIEPPPPPPFEDEPTQTLQPRSTKSTFYIDDEGE